MSIQNQLITLCKFRKSFAILSYKNKIVAQVKLCTNINEPPL